MADEFEGFANAPVDKDGKRLDFRDVPEYEDDTEAGRIRKASVTTESSVVAYKTEGVATNGYPAAQVPGNPKPQPETKTEENADPDADEAEGKEAEQA